MVVVPNVPLLCIFLHLFIFELMTNEMLESENSVGGVDNCLALHVENTWRKK